ncbi:competence protein ComK [Paucisalibacillus globulus]|uniref:competence protein ComK n=1 Tax=Paucisalibacillus globulus TaxID=351095 RepID=UPI0004040029|nr:competence protein ComK [Paucisalibacillus globulus]
MKIINNILSFSSSIEDNPISTGEVLPHYKINEHTLALIPIKHIDYQTVALQGNKTLYIKKTPIEIIEKGCLDHFMTFEGRRKAITHHTGWTRKVPIPISIHQSITTFPTHALKNGKCCWLFYHQIEAILEDSHNNGRSIVLFKDGMQITLLVKASELKGQLERTRLLLERMVGI